MAHTAARPIFLCFALALCLAATPVSAQSDTVAVVDPASAPEAPSQETMDAPSADAGANQAMESTNDLKAVLMQMTGETETPAAPAANTVAPPVPGTGGMQVIPAPQPQQGAVATTNEPGMMMPVDSSMVEGEKSSEEKQAELRDEAFDASVTGLLPMKPDEIRRFLKTYDDTQEVVQKPIYAEPTPVSSLETVPLEPGAAPLAVLTSVGFVTTVTFVDLTGEPWPIRDMGWAGDFEILQPEQKGNILRITPLTEFAHGNISVRLVGLKAPVILTLKTDREQVQYRLDLRIPDYGPAGAPPAIDTKISTKAGKKELTSVLEGVPPSDAEHLIVSGTDSRSTAYSYNGLTYFRTPLKLLSPAWSASVSSADGMTVYELEDAPVLLLSDNGKMVRAYVKQKEEPKNDF
ncbi:MAG: DotH/IcmK family type IV secretion protein [Pseudobdellovibrionaceae bacterium]